ncbi:hypothetical protein T06_11879 [Trichinella sp. T6]|nr:hypothetical protein T06_11879 [Trichinella sp. T6]
MREKLECDSLSFTDNFYLHYPLPMLPQPPSFFAVPFLLFSRLKAVYITINLKTYFIFQTIFSRSHFLNYPLLQIIKINEICIILLYYVCAITDGKLGCSSGGKCTSITLGTSDGEDEEILKLALFIFISMNKE